MADHLKLNKPGRFTRVPMYAETLDLLSAMHGTASELDTTKLIFACNALSALHTRAQELREKRRQLNKHHPRYELMLAQLSIVIQRADNKATEVENRLYPIMMKRHAARGLNAQ